MRFLTLISIFSLLAAGCASPVSELEDGSFAITAGSAEAIGVLALLNDAATDIDTLDIDAALNVRSARNLISHRDGYDGVFGTYDDNVFSDIEEVDSVRWVGPTALAQLVSYAVGVGWIPQGDDLLGTWDNVTFTVNEAQDTLDYANDADMNGLDIDLGLDSRAADSIVAAQPIATVEELAGLYYVGHSALTLLKETAAPLATPVEEFVDQFNHDEELDIPDADPSGIDSAVNVPPVPDVALEITFLVDFQHDAPGDLEVELTAPNGQVWTLTNGANSVNVLLDYTADPEGLWTLNVADLVAGTEGTIYGWALEVVNSP